MGFAQESGYTPATVEDILDALRVEINAQFGTTYTAETFVGTNWYKYMYAAAQRMQENEVKASEIFAKLQQYFVITNERIQRPVATNPGLIEAFEDEDYVASVKAMIEADAGKVNICVDVTDDHARGLITITSYAALVSGTDDAITIGATVFTAQTGAATPGAGTFQAATSNAATAASLAAQINAHAVAGALVEATVNDTKVIVRHKTPGTGANSFVFSYTDNDTNVGATMSPADGSLGGGVTSDDDYDDVRLAVATIIKNSVVAGAVTQGNEVETIVLSNGQSFDFRFHQPNRIVPDVKLTVTLSDNNQVVIESPETVKQRLIDNIAAKYRLGRDFEPQKYFTTVDAPWASEVLLEYDIGGGFVSDIYEANFDDLFEVLLENITLVEA